MDPINNPADSIILKAKSEDGAASLINLKLQKLLYYVQAWSYGINKTKMFDGDFEAWIHGPVNRTIYDRFSSTKSLYSEINIEDCLNKQVKLSDEDAEFVDFILENYLKYGAALAQRAALDRNSRQLRRKRTLQQSHPSRTDEGLLWQEMARD